LKVLYLLDIKLTWLSLPSGEVVL